MTEDLTAKMRTIVERVDPVRAGSQACVEAIIEQGGTSYDALLNMLHDSTQPSQLRRTIVWLLAHIDPEASVLPLIRLLKIEPDDDLRIQSTISLGHIGNKSAIDVLLEQLHSDTNPKIRQLSAYSLGQIGDLRVVDEFISVMLNVTENAEVRGQVAEALVEFEVPERVVPALLKVLEDKSPVVRFWATFALGEIGDVEVIPHLEKRLNDIALIPNFGTVGEEAAQSVEAIRDRYGS